MSSEPQESMKPTHAIVSPWLSLPAEPMLADALVQIKRPDCDVGPPVPARLIAWHMLNEVGGVRFRCVEMGRYNSLEDRLQTAEGARVPIHDGWKLLDLAQCDAYLLPLITPKDLFRTVDPTTGKTVQTADERIAELRAARKPEPLAVTVGAVACMERYGGSFAQAIARAWQCADPDNRARLSAAFPELFKRYADIAKETT